MVGTPFVQGLTTSAGLSSSVLHIRHCSSCSSPCLPCRSQKRVVFIKAMSANADHDQPVSSEGAKSPLTVVLDIPRRIWKQTLRPLGDFGFGRRSIWEGGVGLFLVSGTVLALSFVSRKVFQICSKFRKYLAVFEFPQASGICT